MTLCYRELALVLALSVVLATLACSVSARPSGPPVAATATVVPVPTEAGAIRTGPRPTDLPLSPPATVRAGIIAGVGNAGMYVGYDKGYFREQGIELEMIEFAAITEMVPLLATGQIEVAGGGTSAGLVNAVARDFPVRMVADRGSAPRGFGFQGLVVRKELVESGAFEGCPSFKGLRVANPAPGNSLELALDRLLRDCGLGLSDIQRVTMSFADIPVALHNGAIDAGFLPEPNLTRGLTENLFLLYKRTDEFYPNQVIAVVMYGPQLLTHRREVGERFMLAYIRGVRDYWAAFTRGTNKAEIIEVLMRHTTLKDPVLYERIVPAGLNPDGYINMTTFGDDISAWISQGHLSGSIKATDVVDPSFVDYAIDRLGHYVER